jgi:hypothetical protein
MLAARAHREIPGHHYLVTVSGIRAGKLLDDLQPFDANTSVEPLVIIIEDGARGAKRRQKDLRRTR